MLSKFEENEITNLDKCEVTEMCFHLELGH